MAAVKFIQTVQSEIPCRDDQFNDIFEYICEPDEPVPPCLYLYGSTATGKTLCVDRLLRHFNYKHVVLNAAECYSQRVVYEAILNGLSGHVPSRENNYTPLYKCDNIKDFIRNLDQLYTDYEYEPVIIVIDKAEKLRDMEQYILPVFLNLKDYCSLNVCVMLISDVIFEKYYTKTGLKEPIKIFFPQYSKEELFAVLSLYRNEFIKNAIRDKSIDARILADIQRTDVFSNYLNAFLSVFHRLCRDLAELKHMAISNYAIYCSPIIDGAMKADDVTKLWRNIAPALKSSMELLYLRINPIKNHPSPQTDELQVITKMAHLGITKDDLSILGNEDKFTDELFSMKTFAQNFELPFYAKYLLIAAYLASFNPAKEDKRLFMKNHGKQRKRMQQVNAKAVISEKLGTQLGPKPFTLDRLLAIFYAIIEERVGLTANLLVQVSSLVSLRLLTASSDMTKYKCTVGYEFISEMAKTVGFNIRKYLYDFI